jgi:tetratricopeptide (TPR) repeat protein
VGCLRILGDAERGREMTTPGIVFPFFLYLLFFALGGSCVCRASSSSAAKQPDLDSTSPLNRVSTSDSVVIIITTTLSDNKIGSGAVIGDGSLVVTAWHLVFESSETGLHSMRGITTVISPYLGRVCNARVLIANRELDAALLEIPWRGHPGFKLLSDNEVHEADRVRFESYILKPSVNDNLSSYDQIKTTSLLVESILCRHGIPSQIIIRGHGKLDKGWSGCPIISEKDDSLIGCFTELSGQKPTVELSFLPDKSLYNCTNKETASGPAVGLVRQLVSEVNRTDSLLAKTQRILRQPNDSREATQHLLHAFQLRSTDDDSLPQAMEELNRFLTLRPNSITGKVFLASWFEDAGRPKEAEQMFEQALATDAANFHSRIAYGQFLASYGRPSEAADQFRQAKVCSPDNSLADCMLAQVLAATDNIETSLAAINSAIEEYPENSRLHAVRGLAYMRNREPDAAIESMKKAITLWPENQIFRRILAVTLENKGRLDEAELHLRDLTVLNPDDPGANFLLAKFLATHRPALRTEAIELANRALSLSDQSETEQRKIRELLRSLNEKSESQNENE